MYREKEFAGAFFKVKNGITVMTGNSSGLMKAKIKGLPIKELKDKYFLLENLCETGQNLPVFILTIIIRRI